MPKVTHSPDDKARAVLQNLQDGVSVSEICRQMNIQPAVFYQWRKTFLESASSVFANSDRKVQKAHEREVAGYKEAIQRKDHVIAELLEEYTALKKSLGEI